MAKSLFAPNAAGAFRGPQIQGPDFDIGRESEILQGRADNNRAELDLLSDTISAMDVAPGDVSTKNQLFSDTEQKIGDAFDKFRGDVANPDFKREISKIKREALPTLTAMGRTRKAFGAEVTNQLQAQRDFGGDLGEVAVGGLKDPMKFSSFDEQGNEVFNTPTTFTDFVDIDKELGDVAKSIRVDVTKQVQALTPEQRRAFNTTFQTSTTEELTEAMIGDELNKFLATETASPLLAQAERTAGVRGLTSQDILDKSVASLSSRFDYKKLNQTLQGRPAAAGKNKGAKNAQGTKTKQNIYTLKQTSIDPVYNGTTFATLGSLRTDVKQREKLLNSNDHLPSHYGHPVNSGSKYLSIFDKTHPNYIGKTDLTQPQTTTTPGGLTIINFMDEDRIEGDLNNIFERGENGFTVHPGVQEMIVQDLLTQQGELNPQLLSKEEIVTQYPGIANHASNIIHEMEVERNSKSAKIEADKRIISMVEQRADTLIRQKHKSDKNFKSWDEYNNSPDGTSPALGKKILTELSGEGFGNLDEAPWEDMNDAQRKRTSSLFKEGDINGAFDYMRNTVPGAFKSTTISGSPSSGLTSSTLNTFHGDKSSYIESAKGDLGWDKIEKGYKDQRKLAFDQVNSEQIQNKVLIQTTGQGATGSIGQFNQESDIIAKSMFNTLDVTKDKNSNIVSKAQANAFEYLNGASTISDVDPTSPARGTMSVSELMPIDTEGNLLPPSEMEDHHIVGLDFQGFTYQDGMFYTIQRGQRKDGALGPLVATRVAGFDAKMAPVFQSETKAEQLLASAFSDQGSNVEDLGNILFPGTDQTANLVRRSDGNIALMNTLSVSGNAILPVGDYTSAELGKFIAQWNRLNALPTGQRNKIIKGAAGKTLVTDLQAFGVDVGEE